MTADDAWANERAEQATERETDPRTQRLPLGWDDAADAVAEERAWGW